MDPTEVAARLERAETSRAVTAFPDGSVDTFYEVSLAGEQIDTREAFGEAARGEWSDVFGLERTAREPGGHAPNLVAQAARLGDETTLVGHLDHDAFEDVPGRTVSMGEPASVTIHEFDDGDVLTVETSAAIESWTFEDLRTVLGDDFAAALAADGVCCVNWTSIEALPRALDSLADAIDGLQDDRSLGWFLVDPGAPPQGSNSDVRGLLDALERLSSGYDVVLSGNPAEIETLATGVGEASGDLDAELETLRTTAGIAAAVSHGAEESLAATADGRHRTENFDVEPVRVTGGGDRFDAGLVHALIHEWGWEAALHLGNACASRYVATGETGAAPNLAGFLRERG